MAGKKRATAKGTQGDLATKIASLSREGGTLTLDEIVMELGDARRYEIVASLRELETSGVGTFVVGRKGNRSRFVWNVCARHLVDGATSQVADGLEGGVREARGVMRFEGAGAQSHLDGAARQVADGLEGGVREARGVMWLRMRARPLPS